MIGLMSTETFARAWDAIKDALAKAAGLHVEMRATSAA
jgi:hypothetical protein